MSILIKGMEMPTGNECLILTIYPDGQCFEHVYNGSFGSREERKAVPVPPHGRLIDADEFEKYVELEYETREISHPNWIKFRVWCGDQTTVIEAEGRE